MLHFIRYTCPATMLPTIEGAFAANGYTVTTAAHKDVRGMTTVVLQHGATIVLLMQIRIEPTRTIEIWRPNEQAAAATLESLPIELHQEPGSTQ